MVKTAQKSNEHYTTRNLTKKDATKKDAKKKDAHCGANLRPKGAILVFSYASSS